MRWLKHDVLDGREFKQALGVGDGLESLGMLQSMGSDTIDGLGSSYHIHVDFLITIIHLWLLKECPCS